jgi:hypothetical protein
MCAYSNIGDIGRDMWPKPFPGDAPWKYPQFPYPGLGELPDSLPKPVAPWTNPLIKDVPPYNGPTKEQFEEFLQLMRQARKFDEAMGHPNCEQREKLEWMKGIAEYLGCDVSDLIPK